MSFVVDHNYNNTIVFHRDVEKLILSMLPHQDLYRLRVVCKRWNVLLTDICNAKFKPLKDAALLLCNAQSSSNIEIKEFYRHLKKMKYETMINFCQIANNIKFNVYETTDRMAKYWITKYWQSDKYTCEIHFDSTNMEIYVVVRNSGSGFYKLRATNVNQYVSYVWIDIDHQIRGPQINRDDFIRGKPHRKYVCDFIDNFYRESELVKIIHGVIPCYTDDDNVDLK